MDNSDQTPRFGGPANPSLSRERPAITVSELNRRARNLLEANLELLWVAGELSNVVRAASGHWYFSLKDNAAQVRCVMFKNRASALGFTPENGMQVEVRALPSLYEPRGDFQLGVENMRRAGQGALFEAFARLKAKLSAEGLFDEARKQPLPFLPRRIGIVTSLQAAALRDVVTTLDRRAPMVDVILYPTAVQGAGSAAEIAAAIDAACSRREVDVLIICRGGGSIEDLWSFNDEGVARAIVRLQDATGIPVISGVGHETDFTICDFVADRRAPTPTAAAELAAPLRDELLSQVGVRRESLYRTWQRLMQTALQRLDRAARGLLSPAERLARERDRLSLLTARARHSLARDTGTARHQLAISRQHLTMCRPDPAEMVIPLNNRRIALQQALGRNLSDRHTFINHARKSLELLSPDMVLSRGYGIVENQGRILRRAQDATPGTIVAIRLAEGGLDAEVLRIHDKP
jgi:exodeoxyribonuclease VII large subunit